MSLILTVFRASLLIICCVALLILAWRMFNKQPNRNNQKTSIRKPDKFRFKGQIVQDSRTGKTGEILEILESGTKYFPTECLLRTPKSNRCTLIILWDRETTHEQLPANTALISSVVDTHNPLYPALNYLEWAKFRANQN